MNILIALIIAAILHASWNAFVKDQNNGLITVTIISTLMGILMLPFTIIVGFPTSEIWVYLIVSMFAHTFYFYAMTRAYSLYDFSIAYPFARGLAPLLTVLFLILFLDKKIHTFEIIAILIIVSSIFMLLPKNFSELSIKGLLSIFYFPLSIVFYTIIDAEGIQHANNPYQFIVWGFILSAIPMFIFNLITNRDKLILTALNYKLKFLIAGVIAASGYAIILWAYTQAPTHYVASVRESSIIFASLIGLYFFKENGVKKRLLAAFILFMGIVLLQIYA